MLQESKMQEKLRNLSHREQSNFPKTENDRKNEHSEYSDVDATTSLIEPSDTTGSRILRRLTSGIFIQFIHYNVIFSTITLHILIYYICKIESQSEYEWETVKQNLKSLVIKHGEQLLDEIFAQASDSSGTLLEGYKV